MTTKINSLQIENVKRVKAVALEPTASGLTVIGGKNGQGKTSVLDAIAWTLGGAKFEPTSPHRADAMNPASTKLTLSNGIVVERRGKNGTLHVTDPAGLKAGQQLLDSFVSQFALDLPKFLDAPTKDKAQILLRILGIGDQLAKLDLDEKRIYNERHAIGQIADSKAKHAAELPEYPDAPAELVSMSELIRQQQDILARNGANQQLRQRSQQLGAEHARLVRLVDDIRDKLAKAEADLERCTADLAIAAKSVEEIQDESTAELEASIANVESINSQVAANQAKAAATDEAETYKSQYDAKSEEIEAVRAARLALLEGANLPLPELSIVDGELCYRGQRWDCMSHSEQLRVAVAIVRRLNPECGFVLLDKLESMDVETLNEFGAWLESEGLQVIATRVSTGEECTIIIEDGLPQGQTFLEVKTGIVPDGKWGEF